MNKDIKNYLFLLFLLVLFIISFISKGYIFGIPLFYLMGYICIPILIFNGIKEIKRNKKAKGWGNVLISLGLLFFLIKQYIK